MKKEIWEIYKKKKKIWKLFISKPKHNFWKRYAQWRLMCNSVKKYATSLLELSWKWTELR